MTEVDEIEWPAEALEPPVIGDELAQEGFERCIAAEDQVPGVMAYGVEYWERGKLNPLGLCGTDVPGGILFTTEPAAEDVPAAIEPLHGDWDTPLPMLPTTEELADLTHPEDRAFLDEVEARAGQDTGERISLDDVAGLFGADWTDGMDSVDWVRAQRDDAPLTPDVEEPS